MTPEDVQRMAQVAYVMAQVTCAYAEIEAMKAANRVGQASPLPYSAADFRAVPDRFGLGHNDVLTTLRSTTA